MNDLPTLDSHCHLSSGHSSEALAQTGFALAMTLSLDEAARALTRTEQQIAWGVGCYPRNIQAQEAFEIELFRQLIERTAIVGEIGLDTVSKVPLEKQVQTFRSILTVIADHPRFVSIHSYRATGLVLDELARRPVSTPVLHWWTGSAEQTSRAVELGCYFSIHSAIARQSKFRSRVPLDRILLESDHGYPDPPAAIPCRIEWVEHLVAQQYQQDVIEIRKLSWNNFASILDLTGTAHLLPAGFRAALMPG